ncbi:zinc finger BED domain-containing protein DAYSLEEPER-like [Lycium barbarum]|uniref:zinc finger BED domain-containing protein DAYSLEEPER-like n=1 Tax=Lycium barbarum TaxID=112863 RepID=UPI00293EFDB4|nr:zinc finger BED domain-containing protein DAYSLEEPER-like [Lycium barbarum]
MMIREAIDSEDLNIKEMAIEMEKKFKKYWQEEYSPIATMAVVLDPRYKLSLVDFCFSKLDLSTSNEKVKAVEDNMQKLFKEYLKPSISDVDTVRSNSGGCDVEMADEMEEYDNFVSPSQPGSKKTQLSLYLEEPVLVRKGNENLDVLKFWKDNRIKYPELSLMACDLLSIPITSVSSESAFSVGGRVIGKFQTSILPENAEAKLCSRDWLYGHQASDDSEEEDDIAIDMGKFAAMPSS